ncbi:MAG: AAA family ATPase [Thermoplasmata archaeon]|nr:AAA family ATPase [Thermoplasmata archaeon]
MRNLPVGIEDFAAIRDRGLYYADKTSMIAEIERLDGTGVFIITRPRRFGKSLSISMLDAYFNMEYAGNTWFDGLDISRTMPDDPMKNSRPVVLLCLKDLDSSNYAQFKDDLSATMSELFGTFEYLSESDRVMSKDREWFREIFDGKANLSVLKKSIRILCRMLERHHGRKPVVLIDEYDNAVNNAYSNAAVQRNVMNVLRGLLSQGLKGNKSMEFAVVTGVMQISKEGLFSGMNNVFVYNVLNPGFGEMFGFTEEEVRKLLEECGHPEKMRTAKRMYDGYRFGDVDVYNPWSILCYAQSGFKADLYWANTGSDAVLRGMIRNADDDTCGRLVALASGGRIEGAVDSQVTFEQLTEASGSLMSVLVMSGYLKAVPRRGGGYRLSAPNGEVRSILSTSIASFASPDNTSKAREFSEALVRGDTDAARLAAERILRMHVGSLALKCENDYRNLFMGLLMASSPGYAVSAEFEAGDGRYDLRMSPERGGVGAVIEVKHLRKGGTAALESAARGALEQALSRGYAEGLPEGSHVYGMAFTGKTVFVVRNG